MWVPKYRKVVLGDPVARRCKQVFQEIAERYGFAIVEQEVMPDHVHLFVSAPPPLESGGAGERPEERLGEAAVQGGPEAAPDDVGWRALE